MNAEDRNHHLISTVPPRNIDSDSMFMVNLNRLKHPEDILSDQLGTCRQTETSDKFYIASRNPGGLVTGIQICKRGTTGSILVTRRPYVNKSDGSLKKVIVNIKCGEVSHPILLFR